MTGIGSRGKIGTGHSRLGSRSGGVMSERHSPYSSAKTDAIWNWLLHATAKTKKTKSHFKEIPMECQRCLLGKEAKYRVYTEAMEMKVCRTCAEEARRLGIAVEPLDDGKGKSSRTVCGAFASA
jgi:hypothetical protein